MITESDGYSTLDLGKYYVILPSKEKFIKLYDELGIKYKALPEGFSYRSDKNKDFLNVHQIRELIKKHISPDFKPIENTT